VKASPGSADHGEAEPRPGVSGVVQVAYLVDDVRTAALRHSSQFGSGPWFVGDHIPLQWVMHEGHPARFDHSSAYGQWGEVMVEMVRVHVAEPDSLAVAVRCGQPGLHHLARMVDDLDVEARHLDGAGCPQALLAATARGQRFAFHAAPGLGHLLEIYEPTDGLRAFYRGVAEAALGWEGSEPIRPLSDAVQRRQP
jgi:hypothetical protein